MESRSTWAHNTGAGLKVWVALPHSSCPWTQLDSSLTTPILSAHGVQHEPGRHGGGALRETAGEADHGHFHRGDHSGGDHGRWRQRLGAGGKWEFQLSFVCPLRLFSMQGRKNIYFCMFTLRILVFQSSAEQPPMVSTSITGAEIYHLTVKQAIYDHCIGVTLIQSPL